MGGTCRNCGNTLENEDNFCQKCGTVVEEIQVSQPKTQSQTTASAGAQSAKKNNHVAIVIIAIVVAFIVLKLLF